MSLPANAPSVGTPEALEEDEEASGVKRWLPMTSRKAAAKCQGEEAWFSLLASLLLVVMPFVPSSFLLLVVWPGATSSVLAPSSDGLCY